MELCLKGNNIKIYSTDLEFESVFDEQFIISNLKKRIYECYMRKCTLK